MTDVSALKLFTGVDDKKDMEKLFQSKQTAEPDLQSRPAHTKLVSSVGNFYTIDPLGL